MNKLKTIGLTAIITIGIMIIGYTLIPKDNPTGGAVQNAPTYTVATTTHYTIGDDISSKVLNAKSRRAYVRICNDTPSHLVSQDVYVNLSSTPIIATTSAHTVIENDECWEITRDNLYVGEIQLMTETSSSTNAVKVMELSD